MRLVIARCSVDYAGRLTAHLPSAPRLILVKADGSVSIHADDRAYKPLNWMSPPCTLKEGTGDQEGVWTVVNKAGEKLIITMEEVLHDSSHELGVDPGLIKDGVEAHLQELLADRIETLGEGYTLIRREYMTAIGPVDILCRDAEGRTVAVEIKRRGEIDGVEQLTRYLELLNRDPHLAPCAASSPRRRSSRRPGSSRPTGASAARSSTTTRCAASRTTNCGCSEIPPLRRRGPGSFGTRPSDVRGVR
ncbi:hypothetical protein SHKM778_17270 [Streptomyces sp. KM77-8]|uniref:Endonuclease NucS n=1 Tax=Streptomyces haneummycinicus TaxID=3074435 RepID=A0AAT9HD88_9ACTN